MQEQKLRTIVARLKEVRRNAGLTLAQVAQQAGYKPATLSGAENEHYFPSERLLCRWRDALRLNDRWLRTGKGERFVEEKDAPASQMQPLPTAALAHLRRARMHAEELGKALDDLERELGDR